jgi:MoaA/NifB/PqqE/SkfB family radical SAM enzyme
MSTQTFDLLTINTAGKNGDGPAVEGLLAGQGVDLRRKYPWLIGVGKALAACSRGGRCRLLSLEMTADPESETLTARPRGPLAPLVKGAVRRFTARLNGMGHPVALRDGGFAYNLYQPPVPSRRMINHLARRFVRRGEPLRPSTCTLQITSRCQLDCYHCSAARFKTKARRELTTAEWFTVIDQSLDMGIFNIVFTGGEPLLHPDLCKLVAHVDRDRAQAMMFTNGLLLTEEYVARLVDAGLYSLNVSLDDPRAEVHNDLRRTKDGYEKALAGAERALAGGLLVGISTYAGPDAVHQGLVEQTIEIAKNLGVHEVTVFDVVPTGKLLEEKSLLTAEDKQQLMAMERACNETRGCPHIVTQALVNGPEGAGCFAGFSQFYLTAYGDLDPCDFTPLTFGNVLDESLETLWDRMIAHPAYQNRCNHCRMQDPEFRRQYINDIPEGVLLPWAAVEEARGCAHSTDQVAAPAPTADNHAAQAEISSAPIS